MLLLLLSNCHSIPAEVKNSMKRLLPMHSHHDALCTSTGLAESSCSLSASVQWLCLAALCMYVDGEADCCVLQTTGSHISTMSTAHADVSNLIGATEHFGKSRLSIEWARCCVRRNELTYGSSALICKVDNIVRSYMSRCDMLVDVVAVAM